jgi:hypothetical protein
MNSVRMSHRRQFALTGPFVSHTFVDKLGEKGWINDELAPPCVVSGRRLGGNRLVQRRPVFFRAAIIRARSGGVSNHYDRNPEGGLRSANRSIAMCGPARRKSGPSAMPRKRADRDRSLPGAPLGAKSSQRSIEKWHGAISENLARTVYHRCAG